MKTSHLLALLLLIMTLSTQPSLAAPVSIAIHGGAGTILKENLTPEQEANYREKLRQALKAGHALLLQGKTSVEAVQAAIMIMEDSPLFNAGKGAVFAHDKSNKMDASIMRGSDLNAGAVAGVTHIKNPILLASLVMEKSVHVMLSGDGAEEFAQQQGVELEDPSYFFTTRRWDDINKLLQKNSAAVILSEDEQSLVGSPNDHKFGTVGAVALDAQGNLAAGTSTGGMTNKRFGRIGDSPVIGAGTYADNASCAISATGHGEYFIRAAVAHDICARKLYLGISLQQAADQVIMDKLVKMKGGGGVVAMDPTGSVVFSFNTKGMYRGSIGVDGQVYIGVYGMGD